MKDIFKANAEDYANEHYCDDSDVGNYYEIYKAYYDGAMSAELIIFEKIEKYFKENYNMPDNFMIHLKSNIKNY